ncbi:unnamed protein product [Prorocentrum cordatum]|uniref:Uncharacterized protein n=1 Tax=Prorocentrum cordatum TaxID=2364126 RepID=A0ABN9X9C7_9DINO|nr:unnamed protein product [Polarella glacialis]
MPRARACFLAALLLGRPAGAVQLQSAAAAEASTATGVSADTPFVETLEDTPPELPGQAQEENATQAASDPGRMCTASSLACGPARPRSAGCFVWLPSGCKTPHHFHAKFNWRRDTWGEANAQAGQSEKACKARKQAFDAWCGVTDTVMLLTSPREVLVEDEGGQGEAPEAPEAVPQAVAEADAAAEEARAADVVDSLPEAAPALPRSTGCFVWLPSGCKAPRHLHAMSHWRRDAWGEANAKASQGEEACKARKHAFDAFCGVTDAVMLPLLAAPHEASTATGVSTDTPVVEKLKDTPPELPGQAQEENATQAASAPGRMCTASSLACGPARPRSAGCFAWLPSGCKTPHHFHAKFQWRRDTWGEANAQAGQSEKACKVRKQAFDAWCGVTDTVMLLTSPREVLVEDEGGQGEAPEAPEAVPQAVAEADAAAEEARAADVVDSLPEAAPALPRSTGCFVWLPSGCKAPRHLHAMSHWRRDAWGEANAKASQGEEACKARKHAFDAFCGVTDAVMLPLLAAPHDGAASGSGGPPATAGPRASGASAAPPRSDSEAGRALKVRIFD